MIYMYILSAYQLFDSSEEQFIMEFLSHNMRAFWILFKLYAYINLT